jgi:hypothetical protein
MMFGSTGWIYAIFVAISAATGERFEIEGMPLPASWFHAALFTFLGSLFWFGGPRWDSPAFVAFRARRPWLVPVVGLFVILPASLALIFVLVQ